MLPRRSNNLPDGGHKNLKGDLEVDDDAGNETSYWSTSWIMNVISPAITAALPDAPALAEAFTRLARGETADIQSDLSAIETDHVVDGTTTKTHCYSLALDGMGWPRTGLLVDNICSLVVDYAIPRSRIREATELCEKGGNKGPLVRLAQEAKSLFTHLKQSGEGGELLLFCLAEMILGFPQVLAKMSLKTATDVHYHGADGIHASIDPASGKLCLWWGESKLHKTASGAIRECFKSLAPFLIEPQSAHAKRERDLRLLRSGVNLDDPSLEAAIKAYLSTSDPLYKKLVFGGIGLIGFNHACYPKHPQAAEAKAITSAVQESSSLWKKNVAKHVTAHSLGSIDIHLFLLPFPSVDDFRKAVLKAVGV